MELTENFKQPPSCQCRNSIKLRIIEHVNNLDKPEAMYRLIDTMFDKLKAENKNIVIDDDFLKTYIRSIISEMVDSKLINLFKSEKKETIPSLFYIRLDFREGLLLADEKIIKSVEDLNNNSKLDDSNIVYPTQVIKGRNSEASLNNSVLSEKVLTEKDSNKDDIKEKETRIKLIEEIISLRVKLDKIKKENKTKKLHNEIHRYNEIKDVGQELLGYIASNKGKRIKDLYEDLDISDDDAK
jgi:hypothetical protein